VAAFAQGLSLPPGTDSWWQSPTGKTFAANVTAWVETHPEIYEYSQPVTAHAMQPDPKLTPGTTDPRVAQENIKTTVCKDGYTKTVRDVTEAEKKQVMARYGFPLADLHLVEIDHYFSLELAGSNDLTNLWPQYYLPAPGQKNYLGARQKDVVEDALKRAVCSGKMTLVEAQEAIKTWPEAYRNLKKPKEKE
jgi:hypothetical protein